MNFTSEQVLKLAPDASSAKAGQGLAAVRHWQECGRNEQALWGLCQGSGKNPYQVRVALPELASSCTCPSRKFPCKHALGLLLLAAAESVATADPPAFVAEWLAKREAKAEKVAAKIQAPANPEAAARTAKKREARIGEGLRDFKAWLEDLVGAGFAHASAREPSFWDTRARRLVDAQAPGLARAVGELASVAIREKEGAWPERLLRGLAPLYLAADAFERADSLPPAHRADLLRAVGVPQKQEDVDLANAVEDDWLCIGQSSEDLERVLAHRTWLFGQGSGRHALILNFTQAGQKPDLPALLGASETMRLAFFPGGVAQRALVIARNSQPRNDAPAPSGSAIAAELDRHATARAADPWFSLSALLVRARLARNGNDWWLVDADGGGLPVLSGDMLLWSWFVASGGGPAVFSGEWDGEKFRPLHAWMEVTT
ncbi:SWIM zinc finger family protein [Methylomagnum sp.]